MNTKQCRQSTNSVSLFFIRSCTAVLLLRLLVGTLLPNDYIYIKDSFSDLLIASSILILSLIFLIIKYFNHEPLPRNNFNLPIWMLWISGCLSLIYSADFSQSLHFVIFFCSCILFFHILLDILNTPESFKSFGSYLLPCLFVIIIFALWEYFKIGSSGLIYKRVGSIFQLPNVLAGFLMLALPLLWAGIVLSKNIWQKRSFFLLLVICLLVFLTTFAFLCTVSFLLTTFILSPLLSQYKYKKSYNKTSLLVIGSGILFFLILMSIIRHDFSVIARWEYLKAAIELIKNHPFLGTGVDTFGIVSSQYVNYELGFSAYVHNSYLQWWVEGGLLGFMALVSLVLMFILSARKAFQTEQDPRRKVILSALIWSLSVCFVDNLTNFTMIRPSVSLFWWATLAGFCALIQPSETTQNLSLKKQKILLMTLGSFICIVLFITIKIIFSLLNYQQGMVSLMENNLARAEVSFKKSASLDPTDFHYSSALGLVYIRKYFSGKDSYYLDLAQTSFERAAKLSPYSHKTYFILSNIAKEKGEIQKAQSYLEQAHRLSPLSHPLNRS